MEGVTPSHGGDFLEIWVLKTGFGNAFLSHMRGGGAEGKQLFEVIRYGTPQRGRVWYPPPTMGTFWKFGYTKIYVLGAL